MTAEKFYTNKWGILFAALGATFLWGSAIPFVKLSYEVLEIHPNEMGEQLLFAGYRFFLASLFVLFFILATKKKIDFKKDNFKKVAFIGFFQTFLQYIFFYIGLSLSTGIQGSIIAGTTSFFQILLAHFMYKDDLISWSKVIGLIVGFIGVIFVNITKGSITLDIGIGEILLLLAMLSSAFGNILAKNGTSRMDVASLTSFQMLIGSLGLLCIGVFSVGYFPFLLHLVLL